jgi:hypothetical protein
MSNQSEWIEAMKAKGHTPRMTEDGYLDIFFCDSGFHNGPGCDSCHWSCCHHCDGIEDIPQCSKPALELTATVIAGKISHQ